MPVPLVSFERTAPIGAKRILVTGATGLLGNNVARRMIEAGADVRVLSRSASGCRSLAGLDVDCVVGDIRDAGSVRRAMRDGTLTQY